MVDGGTARAIQTLLDEAGEHRALSVSWLLMAQDQQREMADRQLYATLAAVEATRENTCLVQIITIRVG